MTRVFAGMKPYVESLMDEAQASGLPLQRPLFLHHEQDAGCYAVQDQYLYGRDLLVAPVHAEGKTHWSVYLPAGETWQHWWSGDCFEGGQRVEVPAPLGQPPVFSRVGSRWQSLFQSLTVL